MHAPQQSGSRRKTGTLPSAVIGRLVEMVYPIRYIQSSQNFYLLMGILIRQLSDGLGAKIGHRCPAPAPDEQAVPKGMVRSPVDKRQNPGPCPDMTARVGRYFVSSSTRFRQEIANTMLGIAKAS